MSKPRLVIAVAAMAALLTATGGFAVRAFPLEGAPPAAAQSPPQKIRVGGGVQQTKLTKQVKPVYPPLAKQAGVEGTVRLMIVIDKEGLVKEIQSVSGPPLLVPAAEEAVRQWRYEPTYLNGKPMEVITQVDVNFTLGGRKAAEAAPEGTTAWPPGGTGQQFPSTAAEKGVKRIQVPPNDQAEKVMYSPTPAYPAEAQAAGVRGAVRLNVLIGVDGAVKEVQSVTGHPLLRQAALEAIRQYRYRPTTVDGQPAEVVTQVELRLGPPNPEETTPPRLMRKIEPQYTEQARDAKLTGRMVLSVVIGADGKIHEAQVLQGLGMGLDEKALEAVKQWEFEPALKYGKPVDAKSTIEMNFRLK